MTRPSSPVRCCAALLLLLVCSAAGNGQSCPTPTVLPALVTSPGGTFLGDADTGDFNGDGTPDVACVLTALGGSQLQVFFGDGAGNLTPGAQVLTNAALGSEIAAGDFDGDGDLDAAVGHQSGFITLHLGDGLGGFTSNGAMTTGGTALRDLGIVDVDLDGNLDLVTVTAVTNLFSVHLGDGSGSFGPRLSASAGPDPRAIVFGDFDGDSNLDLATAANGDSSVRVRLGNGDGTFGSAWWIGLADAPLCIDAADVDGDGLLDLAMGCENGSAGAITILRGLPGGTFTWSHTEPSNGLVNGLAIADIDGDGNPDFCGARPNSLLIAQGDGNGHVTGVNTFSEAQYWRGVFAEDADGDGQIDVVTLSTAGIATWLNACGQLPPAPNPANPTNVRFDAAFPNSYTVAFSPSNGLPLTLDATGGPAGLAHAPTLPAIAPSGSSPVSATATWTPTSADLGNHSVQYTVSDANASASDTVTIRVSETWLVVGVTQQAIPITPGVTLLAAPDLVYPARASGNAHFTIPNDPLLSGMHFYAQVVHHDPTWSGPTVSVSGLIDVTIDGTVSSSSIAPFGLGVSGAPNLGATIVLGWSVPGT